MSHYVREKSYLPLWVLVNALSMGDISKFYSNMIQQEREDVARRLKWGVRENKLASCLFFLASIRNRCAHDERLYSYLSYVNLCNNRYFGTNLRKNDYFAVMVALKMLLPDSRYQIYHRQIEGLFDELTSNLSTITVKKIQRIMGMPNNWKRLKKI